MKEIHIYYSKSNILINIFASFLLILLIVYGGLTVFIKEKSGLNQAADMMTILTELRHNPLLLQDMIQANWIISIFIAAIVFSVVMEIPRLFNNQAQITINAHNIAAI